jgi:hypothetical protein
VGRGPDPDDAELFGESALPKLRDAQHELEWLLDRGYPLPAALTFVGDRHQLAARQRLAVRRSSSSSEQRRVRAERLLPLEELTDVDVVVDGFNLLVTLEVALQGGVVIVGSDGAARDLAGLRGNYHVIEQTERAIELATERLAPARSLRFLLDAPVSNSGRLRGLLEARGHRADLCDDVDGALVALPNVVSADGAVLDACASWFNVARAIVETIPRAHIVRLDQRC